jgi:capsular exopolysaccharide synthesis family protein
MSRFYEALLATQTATPPPAATPPARSPEPNPISTGPDDRVWIPPRGGAQSSSAAAVAAVLEPEEDSAAEPLRPAAELPLLYLAGNPRNRVIPNAASAAVTEQYRRLRTKMQQQQAIKPFRTVLITSPGPQEGKTLTTQNLAISFSMLPDYRVLIIDGDLRQQKLSACLGLTGQPGFGNLLDETASVEAVTHCCSEFPISVIGGGNSGTPAAELLHSPQLPRLMQQIAKRFDLILVDSSPVNLITDTQLLARHTDAVLLVARAFTTGKSALEKAANDLRTFRVIGCILNGGTRNQLYGRKNVYY